MRSCWRNGLATSASKATHMAVAFTGSLRVGLHAAGPRTEQVFPLPPRSCLSQKRPPQVAGAFRGFVAPLSAGTHLTCPGPCCLWRHGAHRCMLLPRQKRMGYSCACEGADGALSLLPRLHHLGKECVCVCALAHTRVYVCTYSHAWAHVGEGPGWRGGGYLL